MLRQSIAFCIASIGFSAATADYSCETSASCPIWTTSDAPGWDPLHPFPVSANMQCVPDPIQPQYGFCGYVGAVCSVASDCDYGRCEGGKCQGYLGDSCSNENKVSCLGFISCGTDSVCGGAGAPCINGDADCLSGICDPSTTTCTAAPRDGMQTNAGCSVDANCATGLACIEYTCQPSSTPSAGARLRFKRALGNTHERIARAMASAFLTGRSSTLGCPRGMTACATGLASGSSNLGYECIEVATTLESCGGCLPAAGVESSGPVGQDCTTLPNVDEVSCQNGQCIIHSCAPGHTLDADGLECTR